MNYIIIHPGQEPVITNWYNDKEYQKGSLIINLSAKTYTVDGQCWKEIKKK